MSKFLSLKGKTIKSKSYGYFKVIDINSKYADIVFIKTGFKLRTKPVLASKGSVKDKLYPSIHGVGYVGDGDYKTGSFGVANKAYCTWIGMIKRCYASYSSVKTPSYGNVSVCSSWHNFQNFADWYYKNYPSDGGYYELDKDKNAVGGVKVYSPYTCEFLTPSENVEVSQAKRCLLKSPEGEIFDVFNLSSFCRCKSLHQGHMNAVTNGKHKHHKGWVSLKYEDLTDEMIDKLNTEHGNDSQGMESK